MNNTENQWIIFLTSLSILFFSIMISQATLSLVATKPEGQALLIYASLNAFFTILFLVFATFHFKKDSSFFSYLGLTNPKLKPLFWGILLFISYLLLLNYMLSLFQNEQSKKETLRLFDKISPKYYLYFSFYLLLIVPIVEEILFRGFLLSGFLYSKKGMILGALISSFVWAIIHTQYGFIEIFLLFFMGLIFCWVRIKISLWVAILFHAFNNAIVLYVSL